MSFQLKRGLSTPRISPETLSAARKTCKLSHRANYAKTDGMFVNTVNWQELQEMGAMSVSSNLGFTLPYIRLTYLRVVSARMAPGGEADVQQREFTDADGPEEEH